MGGSRYNLSGGAGGGGVTDHTALTSLSWTVSGHTGTAGSIALFDNLGAASLLAGLAQGAVVFYDGTNWTQLAPGVAGQQLQTQGAGADPIWATFQTVEAKTATYNIDATNDQGRTFTNEGSAGLASARPFNLPTAVAGESFTFVTQDADLLRVVAAAGDTIRLGRTVSAVAGNIESTAIGDVIELIAINATEWIARSIVGTWTVT